MALEPVIDGTLTSDYTDNNAEVDVKDQGQPMVYIEYAKGSENYALLLIEFSTRFDTTEFFAISLLTASPDLEVVIQEIRVKNSGKFRIPIPCSFLEDVMKISVKAYIPGGGPGTIKIFHHNSHYARAGLVK